MINIDSRRNFLNSSALFLLGLLLLSLFLAWIADIRAFSGIHFTWRDTGIGLVAAALMLLVFGGITPVRDQAEKILGSALSACYWYDLLILAILVGFTEELLFRGVLEPWVSRINPLFGMISVSVFFGLLHAVSVGYAIVAGVLGLILSLLAHGPGEYNLLRPIVAHAAYDFAGFLWVVYQYRKRHPEESYDAKKDVALSQDELSRDDIHSL